MLACSQACKMVMPAGTSTSRPSIVSFGISGGLSLRRGNGAVLGDAPLHLRAEMADQPLDWPHRTIGQRADRMPLDFVGHVEQHVDLSRRGVTLNHALHDPPYPTGTLSARGALAAALVLVEFCQPRDRPYDVGGFVHYNHSGGAEPTHDGNQDVEIHEHRLTDRFRYHRHRRTAGNYPEKIVPTATHPATVPLDQFAQRYAHRLFDIAGRVHVARQTIDFGSCVPGSADASKPIGAAP